MTIAYEARRYQLGDFLRRRREALSPDEAGITIRERRRTPGLRRDEVAERANMSVVYYERLERGRGPMPSPSMLNGIAKALRLTAEENEYLYRLVGQQAPLAKEPSGFVDPGLATAMRAVSPAIPASVNDELSTMLTQNAMNIELFGPMAGFEAPRSNIIWRWFTEPAWRHELEPADEHEETSRFFVADLRATVARRCEDRKALAFVDNLVEASDDFKQKWAEHSVSTLQGTHKRILNDRVGIIHVDCTVMLSPSSSQRLMLLQPAEGTDAGERLARLHALIT